MTALTEDGQLIYHARITQQSSDPEHASTDEFWLDDAFGVLDHQIN